jgi:hypothetical protein
MQSYLNPLKNWLHLKNLDLICYVDNLRPTVVIKFKMYSNSPYNADKLKNSINSTVVAVALSGPSSFKYYTFILNKKTVNF